MVSSGWDEPMFGCRECNYDVCLQCFPDSPQIAEEEIMHSFDSSAEAENESSSGEEEASSKTRLRRFVGVV
jgi:hypothetical protein